MGYDVEDKHLKLNKSVRSKLEKLGYVIRECDMGSNFTLMHIRKNGVDVTEIDIPASYNYNGNVYNTVNTFYLYIYLLLITKKIKKLNQQKVSYI